MSEIWDIIVIGGGAAGLMTAASASRENKRVLLLEKNTKLGVKILMSGGSRCNITHACSSQQIVEAFGRSGRFLHSPLAALPPTRVIELIESTGVATKVEPGGKIFPQSDRAIDVRDALVKLASDPDFDGQAEILTGQSCVSIEKSGESFQVQTDSDTFLGKSVVITTGGKSYPGCGTNGDGYAWASHFGHQIVSPVAALTPIINRGHWTNSLKGLTFEDVSVKVRPHSTNKKKSLDTRSGGFLFTHFGFSGPSVLDVSRVVSNHPHPHSLILECDFCGSENHDQLRQRITTTVRENSKQNLNNVISTMFPKRFSEAMLQHLGIEATTRA